jgi:hypothetical protein
MQQKINSSVGSGAQARDNKESPLFDKYIALQKENQKLKLQIRSVYDERYSWMWSALEAQAERDCLREELQEQAQERRKHE